MFKHNRIQTRSHAPAWECIREFDSVNKCFFVCRVEVCIPTETVGTREGLKSPVPVLVSLWNRQAVPPLFGAKASGSGRGNEVCG